MPAVLMDADDEQDVAGEGYGHERVLHERKGWRVVKRRQMTRAELQAALDQARAELVTTRQALAEAVANIHALKALIAWLSEFRVWSSLYRMADGTTRTRLAYWHTADRVTSCEGKDMEEAVRVARDAIRASALRAVRRSGSDSDGGMAA